MLTLEFEVDITDHDVPLIFVLEHHRSKKSSSNEFNSTFTHHPSNTTVTPTYRESLLNKAGICTILVLVSRSIPYRGTGKGTFQFWPSYCDFVGKLIKKSVPEEFENSLIQELEKISKTCRGGKTNSSQPPLFRVAFRIDEILFEHEIELDLIWIEGDAILHIVDRDTHYSVANFLKNGTSEHIFENLQDFSFTAFTGCLCIIAHDQGSQFTAEHFQISCSLLGIISKETRTQS